MGYMSVKTMVDHLDGKTGRKGASTPAFSLATIENMDTEDMKELLMPDLKKWLKEE
jgi:hypothetical protein